MAEIALESASVHETVISLVQFPRAFSITARIWVNAVIASLSVMFISFSLRAGTPARGCNGALP